MDMNKCHSTPFPLNIGKYNPGIRVMLFVMNYGVSSVKNWVRAISTDYGLSCERSGGLSLKEGMCRSYPINLFIIEIENIVECLIGTQNSGGFCMLWT